MAATARRFFRFHSACVFARYMYAGDGRKELSEVGDETRLIGRSIVSRH